MFYNLWKQRFKENFLNWYDTSASNSTIFRLTEASVKNANYVHSFIFWQPLAQYISQHKGTKGLEIVGLDSKMALFAKNIIFNITLPHISITCLFQELNKLTAIQAQTQTPPFPQL